MKRWLELIFRGPLLPGALLALAFTALAVELVPAGAGASRNAVIYESLGSLSAQEGENVAKHTVGTHETASVHHLRIAEGVKAHHHRLHDETVVVLGGEGRMAIGKVSKAVRPGTVLVIPRGTVHSLEVTGRPVEAISIFSPPFDGEDRVFVD